MIACSPELVERSIDEFWNCSGGRHECVAYWLAMQAQPRDVVEVVHPDHTASVLGYAVDGAWLTRFSFDLADRGVTAVAQVHTHPGMSVDHSETDDEFVLVPSAGFLSIVVPDFARDFTSSRWGIHVLEPSGRWRRDPEAVAW